MSPTPPRPRISPRRHERRVFLFLRYSYFNSDFPALSFAYALRPRLHLRSPRVPSWFGNPPRNVKHSTSSLSRLKKIELSLTHFERVSAFNQMCVVRLDPNWDQIKTLSGQKNECKVEEEKNTFFTMTHPVQFYPTFLIFFFAQE